MQNKDQKEVAKDPIVPASAQNTLKKESKEIAKEPIVPTSNQASPKKDAKDTTKEKENKDAQSTTKPSWLSADVSQFVIALSYLFFLPMYLIR